MADTFSVSARASGAAQHPHRQTPFDDILALEQEQESRVQREIAAFDEIEKEKARTLREEEAKHLENVRAEAQKEIDRFTQHDLPARLATAQKAATDEAARIEHNSASKKQSAVDTLVARMLSPDTLSQL